MSEEVKKKSKATYNTKKQTIAFGAWLVSDERRLFYQKRNREFISRGLIDPIPWATAVRSVTEEDYKMWKEGKQAQPKKFTAEDMQEIYEKGVNDELKRWTNGSSD